ncbi:hypothetical protein EES41_02810 [Streptomyces sp. ADI95-16]|nr:hypothetical protein EES41_02810 [Streptomyces sp. ADI95-16]
MRELRVLEAAEPNEEVLAAAGVAGAAALALYEDDETNVGAPWSILGPIRGCGW